MERRWHTAVSCLVAAVGLEISIVWHADLVASMTGLTIATCGIMSALPVFWGNPTAFLGGIAAAAGIALINSVGNLAGFVAPFVIGWIKQATQSTDAGLHLLALLLVLGAALVLTLPRPGRAERG
jgi:nitrate/nitrite transporter NarK